jgi:hypothetical protein
LTYVYVHIHPHKALALYRYPCTSQKLQHEPAKVSPTGCPSSTVRWLCVQAAQPRERQAAQCTAVSMALERHMSSQVGKPRLPKDVHMRPWRVGRTSTAMDFGNPRRDDPWFPSAASAKRHRPRIPSCGEGPTGDQPAQPSANGCGSHI